MQFDIIALVFAVLFVAELPDKSMLASLILGSRLPRTWVWLGAAAAFLTHVIIAVAAGGLLSLLPHRAVEAVVGALFLGGAGLILFGKHGLEDSHKEAPKVTPGHNFWKVFATAYGVIFIGEWGDITQIATANYAAKYHDPLSVAFGATAALWAVTGLAIFAGSRVLNLIPAKVLQRVTGLILLAFAVHSLLNAVWP